MEDESKEVEAALDGVIVQHRADQAYEMRLAGKSPSEIANALGYENPQSVGRAILERFKHEATFLEDDERLGILNTELARLDKLQSALWDSALYGDVKSVDTVLKIIAMRMKITGVDQPDTTRGQNTVLVVGGNEQSYIETLKQMTEKTDGQD
jgi:hypothetical protein